MNKENSSLQKTLHCKVVEFNRFEKSETSVGLVWPAGQAEKSGLLAALVCFMSTQIRRLGIYKQAVLVPFSHSELGMNRLGLL